MTAPAFGSLQPVYKKIAFSFAIPTIIFLGSLYSVRPSLPSPYPTNTPRTVRERALRVLPRVRQGLAPPLQQHAQRVGHVGGHHCGELGGRVRDCGGYSVLLGLAVVDVLALRCVSSFSPSPLSEVSH